MAPQAWSDKDERQYEHIKESSKKRGGRSAKRAKEIAARTVNKQRAEEGRTKSKSSRSRTGRKPKRATRATRRSSRGGSRKRA
jgi:hypothetical protein